MGTATQSISKVKKFYRAITLAIAGILVLIIGGLLFCQFMPGYGIYVVRSGSMSPAVNAGDVVISRPVGDSLAVGQIITFKHQDTLVTHRIFEIKDGMIRTKGDANEDPDASLIDMSQVQGVYLFDIPYVGYINKFVSTRLGWFLAIIVPTIVLVIWLVIEILKEAFKTPAGSKNSKVSNSSMSVQPKAKPSINSKLNQSIYKPGVTYPVLPTKEVAESIQAQPEHLKEDY